jgi:amidase
MALPDLNECTITELLQGLNQGLFTSTQLVKVCCLYPFHQRTTLKGVPALAQTYIARTTEVNDELHAVLEINNAALKQAATRDAERERRGLLSADPQAHLPLLHGIPVLVKDNIATASPSPEEDEKLSTSVGSLALLGAFPSRDARVVARLRESGAIILGKTAMVRE